MSGLLERSGRCVKQMAIWQIKRRRCHLFLCFCLQWGLCTVLITDQKEGRAQADRCNCGRAANRDACKQKGLQAVVLPKFPQKEEFTGMTDSQGGFFFSVSAAHLQLLFLCSGLGFPDG